MENIMIRKREYTIDEKTKLELQNIRKVIHKVEAEQVSVRQDGLIIYLKETGWENPSDPSDIVGTWDPVTRKAYLIKNVQAEIFIDTDINKPLYLDGNNFTVNHNRGAGIFVRNSMQNVTIKNFIIKNFAFGIVVQTNSHNIIIENNKFINNSTAIYLQNGFNIIRKNTILSNIRGTVGINLEGRFQNHIEIECNTICFHSNIATGIRINRTSKSSIKCNKIIFENIENYIESPDVNIDLVGIYMEASSLNTIENNFISFSKNEINVGIFNSYIYFDGILASGCNSNIIKCNDIIVKGNSITIDNTVKAREQQTVFYGINFAEGNGGNEIEGNDIIIDKNSITATTAPIKYSTNKFRGVFFNYNNNVNGINNNNIVIAKNIFEINCAATTQFLDNYFDVVYLNGANTDNKIEMNKILVIDNLIIDKDIKEYKNQLTGIHLSDGSYDTIICKNLIKIINNRLDMPKRDGTTVYDKNKLIGIFVNNANNNVVVNENCIFVKDNTIGVIEDIKSIYIIALIALANINYNITIGKNMLNCSQGDGVVFITDGNDGALIFNNSLCNNSGFALNIGFNRDVVIKCNEIRHNGEGGLSIDNRNNSILENNFINRQGTNAFNLLLTDEPCYFYSNYWSDWNGVTIPYDVNNAVDYHPLQMPIKLNVGTHCCNS